MKIAYLILAHDNPAHLQRLIQALSTDNTSFYVHIDRKTPLGEFSNLHDLPQTNIIEERVSACWGGFSLVQATLNLMTAATRASPAADRYVLLSGADYPIRSNEQIFNHFRSNNSEHIGLLKMPSEDGRKPLERLTTLHFEGSRGRYKPQRVLLSQANRLLVRVYKRPYKSVLGSMVPYAGSQWWALTDGAVRYIIDFTTENKRFTGFYKHSLIPDEMFFQTILGNSPFKARTRRNLTYVDWTKGLSRNPAPLTHQHIDQFSDPCYELNDIEGRGPCLYARKFDTANSSLLDRIDMWRSAN